MVEEPAPIGTEPHDRQGQRRTLIIAGATVLVVLMVLVLALSQRPVPVDDVPVPPVLTEEERRAQEARDEFAAMLESTPEVSEEEAIAARDAFTASMEESESVTEEDATAARAEFIQSIENNEQPAR